MPRPRGGPPTGATRATRARGLRAGEGAAARGGGHAHNAHSSTASYAPGHYYARISRGSTRFARLRGRDSPLSLRSPPAPCAIVSPAARGRPAAGITPTAHDLLLNGIPVRPSSTPLPTGGGKASTPQGQQAARPCRRQGQSPGRCPAKKDSSEGDRPPLLPKLRCDDKLVHVAFVEE